MKHQASTIHEDRALTESESSFIEWLLRNGGSRSALLVPQLSRARVTGRCSCGCASINLSVDGVSHYGEVGIEPVCEYQWRSEDGELFGVFAFACGELLSGIDLWSIDGRATPSELPPVAILELMP